MTYNVSSEMLKRIIYQRLLVDDDKNWNWCRLINEINLCLSDDDNDYNSLIFVD